MEGLWLYLPVNEGVLPPVLPSVLASFSRSLRACVCVPVPLASSSLSLCWRDTGGTRRQHGQSGRKKELPATPERPRSFQLTRPSTTSAQHGHRADTVRPAQATRTLPQLPARCPSRKGSHAQYTAYIINTDWAEHWTCNHEPAHERRRQRVKGEKKQLHAVHKSTQPHTHNEAASSVRVRGGHSSCIYRRSLSPLCTSRVRACACEGVCARACSATAAA